MPSSLKLDRKPQRRGKAGDVRRALASALYALMKTKQLRDIRIIDLTSAVGVSQPNFYQHFSDLNEALIASSEIGWSRFPDCSQFVGPEMTLAQARTIVASIIDFWIENGSSLAWAYYVDDERFEAELPAIRSRATEKLVRAIANCITVTRVFEREPSAAHPTAWAQLTLTRIDSFGLVFRLLSQNARMSRETIIDTAAAMFMTDLGIPPR